MSTCGLSESDDIPLPPTSESPVSSRRSSTISGVSAFSRMTGVIRPPLDQLLQDALIILSSSDSSSSADSSSSDESSLGEKLAKIDAKYRGNVSDDNDEIEANEDESNSISFSDDNSEDESIPDRTDGFLVKFLKDKQDSNSKNTCAICNKLYLELFKHTKRRVLSLKKEECHRSFCEDCKDNFVRGTLCMECETNIRLKSLKYQSNLKTLIFTCPEESKCDQILTYDQFVVHRHKKKPRNFFDKQIQKMEQLRIEYKEIAENVEFKKARILDIDEKIKNCRATITDNTELIDAIQEASANAEKLITNFETEKRNLKTQIASLKKDAKNIKSNQKQSINDREDRCGICYENYDNDSVKRAIPPCFHSFCFACLTSLEEKICPTCREEYEESDVKVIH